MRHTVCIVKLISSALILTSFSACEKQQREHTQVVAVGATPLELDPLDHVELSRWWSNGKQLLQLDDDGSYKLYEGQNRYATPVERGRWSQQSYAVLWLEPYNTRRAERNRVGITKVDGRLAVVLPKGQSMLAIAAPPAVIEDRLIGRWSSAPGASQKFGVLRLGSDGRYALTPAAGVANQPIARAGQSGAWKVRGDEIILQSDAAASDGDLVRFPFVISDQRVTINTPSGPLVPADELTARQ
jgi:hypothetical protein